MVIGGIKFDPLRELTVKITSNQRKIVTASLDAETASCMGIHYIYRQKTLLEHFTYK
jgi:hypothetical protein